MAQFQSIPENKRIISALEDYLCENALNGLIAYAKINRVAGKDVQRSARYLLESAIERAERRLGCVFGTVHSVGIKRLEADETSSVGVASIRGIRRKARKSVKRMARVNSNEMGADARMLTTLKIVHLQYIADMADNKRTTTFPAPVTADPFGAKKSAGL